MSGNTLYTGVCNMKVKGVNPTRKELSEILGKEMENEPTYKGTDDSGTPTMRIDFWLQAEDQIGSTKIDTIVKMPIYLDSKDMKNQAGTKNKYINNKLQTTYATSIDTLPEWYETSTVRVAKKGEEELLMFLSTLAKLDRKEDSFDVNFGDYNAILKGDTTEIKSILEQTSDNTIRVLLGVNSDLEKERNYQRVYPNCFLYGGQGGTDYMDKKARGEYGGCNLEFSDSMELKEYSPSEEKKEKDDLPF